MKATPTFLSLLSRLLCSIASAQVEFAGYMKIGGQSRFILQEPRASAASQ